MFETDPKTNTIAQTAQAIGITVPSHRLKAKVQTFQRAPTRPVPFFRLSA